MLRERGVKVEILEDQQGIDLYAKYREKPDQDKEDWKGLAEVLKARKGIERIGILHFYPLICE